MDNFIKFRKILGKSNINNEQEFAIVVDIAKWYRREHPIINKGK